MRPRFTSTAALVGLLTLACGGAETTTTPVVTTTPPVTQPTVPVVAKVTVTGPARLVVTRTDTVRATARTAAGDAITGKAAAFTSSAPTVVSVGTDGAIRSLNPGTAVISAAVDGVVGTITIIASDASLATLAITAPTPTLVLGGAYQFSLTGKDSVQQPVAIRSTTWRTSNAAVATVSASGVVTGIATGTATIYAEGITVTAATALLNVTVVPVPVARIAVAPFTAYVLPRFPQTLHASAVDSAGNTLVRPITWSSSNVDIATVDPLGLVTAQTPGVVTITATSSGKSSGVRLYVTPDHVLLLGITGTSAGQDVSAWYDAGTLVRPVRVSASTGADSMARIAVMPSFFANYRVRADAETTICVFQTVCRQVAYALGAAPAPLSVDTPAKTTVAEVTLRPAVANIVAPATVAAGAPVTVTWTFDETAKPFDFDDGRTPTGHLSYSTAAVGDDEGAYAYASVSRLPSGVFQFSATFTAPASAGVINFQVAGDGVLAGLLSPLQARGETLRRIVVQ